MKNEIRTILKSTAIMIAITSSSFSLQAHESPVETVSASLGTEKNYEIVRLEKAIAFKAEWQKVLNMAVSVYNEMGLADSGLSQKAFEYAWIGYYKLQKKGLLHNTSVLSICDFSQSSSQKRMYIIDVDNKKLLFQTFVAHGEKSGREFANSFSNVDESNKSSLGFYITSNTYYGCNGLSLRIDGVDKGYNDHAKRRNIVVHGAPYLCPRILSKYGVMGTTFGCPAIPDEMSPQIIPVIKDGTCLFIYYPLKKYLDESTVLNG
ncbi:MAG TPA: murein L,D-transpeptidase catalytic domain family protein [Puia sp.]|nr:murein L,D-transpeptidase catalytic domain family protein [Puia sp.]